MEHQQKKERIVSVFRNITNLFLLYYSAKVTVSTREKSVSDFFSSSKDSRKGLWLLHNECNGLVYNEYLHKLPRNSKMVYPDLMSINLLNKCCLLIEKG